MHTYVIAEIGVNHNGNVDEALRLIDAAKAAGADAVKFQLFDALKLKRPEIKHLELSKVHLLNTRSYARSIGLEWLCTPFDVDALKWLTSLHPPYMKLGSGAMFDTPLLEAAAQCGIHVLLSTGMSQAGEVRDAVQILLITEFTLLHCTSAYPAPIEAANLLAIQTLKRAFMCDVGYSDHTTYPDAILAAVTLGATVIEAHLTLDRDQAGPDHAASYEPVAFAETVARVRALERMLGDGVKRTQPSEVQTRKVWANEK